MSEPTQLIGQYVTCPEGYTGYVTHQYGTKVVIEGQWEVSACMVVVIAAPEAA